MISFDEFQELDLRVGKIESVKEHPNADKLYLLDVDIGGGETRQSVAGVKEHYKKEELEGRHVVMLVNLEEATIRGEKSEAMLLASTEGDDVVILEPDRDREVSAGASIS